MNIVSVALPVTGFSSILSLQTLDTNGPIAFILSVGETTSDRFNLYGTLDAAATDSTNAYLIGVFSGGTQNLPLDIAVQAKAWPFLLIQRVNGSTAGNLFVAGNPATLPAVVSVAAPTATGSYSGAAMNLSTLNALTVRIGSSRQMTSADSFEVYLSNDSSLASSAGAYYAGRIYGGGGANVNNTVVVSGFSYAVFLRVGGSTAGTMLAAGVSPISGGGGTLDLDTLAVGNTAVNGPIGALTPAASVDVYNSFLLTQTTAGIVATLPSPTDTTAGKTAFVMNASTATQPIVMYGETIGISAIQLYEWTGAAWVGGRNATQGGNAFGAAMTIGTVDNQTLNLIANNTTGYSDTGVLNTMGRVTGASAVTVQVGTGAANIAANATDHATNLGSTTGASLTTVQGGTSGVTVQPAATGPLTAKSGTTGAATFDSGSTGGVNVGTSNNPKVVTVGNVNLGTESHFLGGGLGIDISTGVGSGGAIGVVADGPLVLDTSGTASVQIGTTGGGKAITIGSATDNTSVTIASGAVAGNILLNSNGGGPGTGATNCTAGTGGITFSCAATGNASFKSGTSGTATFDSGTTGAVNIGTGANAKTVTVGTTTGAAAIAMRAGSGGMTLVNNGTTYTWPSAAPTINGQGLVSTTAGVMSWSGATNVNATKGSAQGITDGGGATVITGWTEVTDTAAAFDPTAGTFTVPVTGFYQIDAQIEWAATAASLGATFEFGIAVNGIILANYKFVNQVAALAQVRATPISRGLQLTAAQTVSFRATLSGAGTNISTTASDPNNGLSITKIG